MLENLKKYDKLYYEMGSSPISDTEYDLLKSEAKKLYPNDPYFNDVGFIPSSNKVNLPFTLGSLTKTKANGSFTKWLNKNSHHSFVITPKLDGMTILCNYINGIPNISYQRGNGEVGTEITEKSKLFCPFITCQDNIWVRGEIVLTGNIHKELGYKTRRNAVSGILNRKDNQFLDKLTVIFYELVQPFEKTESERLDFLNEYFPNNSVSYDYRHFQEIDEQEMIHLYELRRSESITDIDGLVIKINDLQEREDVRYPEFAVAFKVNEDGIETEVTDIVWNTTRTGRVVPVVHIKPTDIDNVIVSKVTGYNADFIENQELNIGCKIKVLRSGGVIPMITEVLTPMEIDLPKTCNCCGNMLKRSGVDLVCDNPNCSDQMYYKVEYFIRTLGAENITEKTLKKINCSSIQDLYSLDEFELSDIDGIGIKRGTQIVDEIQKTLKTTPDKLLASFGINGVSLENSRRILKHFEFDNVFNVTKDQLLQIDGIGDIISDTFVDEINKFKDLYGYLKTMGLQWNTKSNLLKGKQIVMTGSSDIMKREVIAKMIDDNGGYYKKSITKKTDILVIGDINSTTSKAKKARQQGIDIISYEQLFKMMEV